jgi:hypothetical protein
MAWSGATAVQHRRPIHPGPHLAGATNARFSNRRANVDNASLRSARAAAHCKITAMVGNRRSTFCERTSLSTATAATVSASSGSRFCAAISAARYCCKSRKLHQSGFLVKPQNASRSTTRITSVALPKSPMSFAGRDKVPQISTRKPRLRPSEFLTPSAKRLLQHYPPDNGHPRERPTGSVFIPIQHSAIVRLAPMTGPSLTTHFANSVRNKVLAGRNERVWGLDEPYRTWSASAF